MIIFSTSSQVIKTGEQTIKMRLRKPERKYKPLLNKPNKNPENKIPSKRKSKIFFFFHVFTMKKKKSFFQLVLGSKRSERRENQT